MRIVGSTRPVLVRWRPRRGRSGLRPGGPGRLATMPVVILIAAFIVGPLLVTIDSTAARPEKRTGTSYVEARRKAGGKVGAAAVAGLTTQLRTPQQAAQALVGPGITVTGVSFTGAPAALGTFAGGDESIGFDRGVVLSSGLIKGIRGPNEADGLSADNARPGDADLDLLAEAVNPGAGGLSQDATVLQFSIVPDSTVVTFRYVFASEEYNEYVDSPYYDLFGFYINGQNCATIGGQPVSVDTINLLRNSGQYRDNERRDNGNGDLVSPLNTEMDGLTQSLECRATVTPGQPNQIKLAIADINDGVYDSNVMIRAGSLTSGEPLPPNCAVARPSKALITKPDAKEFQTIKVLDVTDPNGSTPTIEITTIRQDEATGTSIDGKGIGASSAKVRMERQRGGNGRVYSIGFTATDGQGDTCAGTVQVGVRGSVPTPVDDGPNFDSTTI